MDEAEVIVTNPYNLTSEADLYTAWSRGYEGGYSRAAYLSAQVIGQYERGRKLLLSLLNSVVGHLVLYDQSEPGKKLIELIKSKLEEYGYGTA